MKKTKNKNWEPDFGRINGKMGKLSKWVMCEILGQWNGFMVLEIVCMLGLGKELHALWGVAMRSGCVIVRRKNRVWGKSEKQCIEPWCYVLFKWVFHFTL